MPSVSATRLRVRSLRFLVPFLLASRRAERQAARSPGFLGGQLVMDRGRVFWTVSVWEGRDAMLAYRNSGAHGAVMARIVDWCDEAATATWEQETAALPDLEELGRRMVAGARFVKLPNGSRAHQAGQAMPPRPRAVNRIRPRQG